MYAMSYVYDSCVPSIYALYVRLIYTLYTYALCVRYAKRTTARVLREGGLSFSRLFALPRPVHLTVHIKHTFKAYM
jgi:hypothetical protein